MNTIHLYFESEWLVRLPSRAGKRIGDVLLTAGNVANALDCFLAMENLNRWYIRDDGCSVIPFVWRVEAEGNLQICLAMIHEHIAFGTPQPITEAEFEKAIGGDFEPLAVTATSTDGMLYIEELARQNEVILSSSP